MKKVVLTVMAIAMVVSSASGATATFNCTPTAGSNSSVILNTLFFTNGTGTGSFLCSDASLGPITLSSVTVSILTDYTKGNGTAGDPLDNSAGFTFSSASTWAPAQLGVFTSTMNLSTGLTLFSVGNLSSQASTFSNNTSGGLTGTSFVQPSNDSQTVLTDSSVINVSAFVDAGGFDNGVSDASVMVTYSYTTVTTASPEPVSLVLFGCGLVAVSLLGRRKTVRK